MAGGQGTRLSSEEPKGMYDVLLPSGKTLFQLQAEKLLKLSQLSTQTRTTKTTNQTQGKQGKERGGEREEKREEKREEERKGVREEKREEKREEEREGVIKWFVMTSPATEESTKKYFEEKKYFGLEERDVFFFTQNTFPSFSNEGKLLLETKKSLCRSPNGNGGVYEALERSGGVKEMEESGVEYLFLYGVDNIAIKLCDPLAIGLLHAQQKEGVEVLVKTTPKLNENEKVGVFALKEGKPGVVEYSEIDSKLSASRDSKGNLIFNTSNICIHLLTFSFLKRIIPFLPSLPYLNSFLSFSFQQIFILFFQK